MSINTNCPNCLEAITDTNPLYVDFLGEETCGNCADPSPAGYDYSPGFEMNH